MFSAITLRFASLNESDATIAGVAPRSVNEDKNISPAPFSTLRGSARAGLRL
jgi:hypothetical protein